MAVEDAPTTELTELERATWRGFLRVHAALLKQLDAELDATHGLPLSHFEVLTALECTESGKLRMADLADQTLLSRSGMTRLVDRLERQGLIERCSCSDDARGCFAVLTPAGRDVLAKARRTHLEGVRRSFLAHCEDRDLERFCALWERMLKAA